MEDLLEIVETLKEGELKERIDSRIKEFEDLGKKPNKKLFKELCFCMLTANFSAQKSISIQREIGDGFTTLSESQLTEKLRELGHRYPDARASYIVPARQYKDSLKDSIGDFKTESEAREWVVRNIKGIGYKGASHFLRNVGYKDLAIIDFHIVDLLVRHKLIERPKTLTKRRYLEIESVLREIADRLHLSLAELDLYLWFAETGRLLK